MEETLIYIERLSLQNTATIVTKDTILCYTLKNKRKSIFYIDATRGANKLMIPLLKLFGYRVNRLEFKLRDIKDESGELSRYHIPRKDLFELRDKVTSTGGYHAMCSSTWKKNRLADCVVKGLVDSSLLNERSAGRLIYLLKVVREHMQSINASNSVFYILDRSWMKYFKGKANKDNIKLLVSNEFISNLLSINNIRNIFRKYPRLYVFIRNIKLRNLKEKYNAEQLGKYKIFVEGRGDLNLCNNGHHSDFFWMLNSKISPSNVLYECHTIDEMQNLTREGVNVTSGYVSLDGDYLRNNKRFSVNKVNGYHKERKDIMKIIDLYHCRKIRWFSFFRNNNVKVYLTWNRVDDHHMVAADALHDNDGISVYWPLSFDGFRGIGAKVCTDVIFSYSKFGSEIEKQCGSKYKYNVIFGYPKDYAGDLLKDEAKKLRKKLQSHGAKKIVFAIDENSVDDSRWHTGHQLQQENYSFILEKVLSTPWLGVIFKPKCAKNLRQRLGKISLLLLKAEKTGRCFIYEESGRYTTSVPPILAGLSADICICAHLGGGTAALECALQGIPTLLIDREGAPKSKLYELPEGKVIFKNWQDTIDAVMEHFSSSKGIPGFGDWSSIIDELDPFRDGQAAKRMGDYLHWLLQGFEKGLNKEQNMANAAERYKRMWGDDKVLSV